ncbi:MAG: hypothetical protein CNE99_03100 [OM182 bacterium MED-G24]|uniref:Gluconate 2-dehydrogenase subunit 3 family protein n=1 Tax=OM182 bacterium MED-G24 TaxID=1986255 RepID=A0A2A5WWZ7_9GAMM|nr:MAG: hypothetical protein CNE99_03100 [OM182 bacterium MED-G24]
MNTITTDNPISSEQTSILACLASILIPASDKYDIPGADDETIMSDIISAAREHAESFKTGLDAFDAYAQSEFDTDFVSLDHDDRMAIVEHFQDNAPHFIHALVSVTVSVYYQDTRVMKSLGLEARPPFPEGYELPQGDWSMLDPVKERGEIWRKAD